MRWTPETEPFGVLFDLFAGGAITADQYEVLYLPLYKRAPALSSEVLFGILDAAFFDTEDYTPDAKDRAERGGIDAEELRIRVGQSLQRLEALVQESPRHSVEL